MITRTLVLVFTLLITVPAQGQFLKKLKQRAEAAAKETVIRKTEEKTERETEAAMDSLFYKEKRQNNPPPSAGEAPNSEPRGPQENLPAVYSESPDSRAADIEQVEELTVYSKFDFVPGEKILMVDDFSGDQLGDFPVKWNTNGMGELVGLDDRNDKWLSVVNGSIYIPEHDPLPPHFTIEFDIASKNLSQTTSSQAMLEIWLDEDNSFQRTAEHSTVMLPFCQYSAPGVIIEKVVTHKREFWNQIARDVRPEISQQAHLSIAVNNNRFRLWINEKKVLDIPKLVSTGQPKYLKLKPRGFKDGEEFLFLSNFKIAAGRPDFRSKLEEVGKFSTTGILFNSGSAEIQAESMGTLKSIATAISGIEGVIEIQGHTDADGQERQNMLLSEQRAHAVKTILVRQFLIDEARLITKGLGESVPIADNSTCVGKAQNRRVEFHLK